MLLCHKSISRENDKACHSRKKEERGPNEAHQSQARRVRLRATLFSGSVSTAGGEGGIPRKPRSVVIFEKRGRYKKLVVSSSGGTCPCGGWVKVMRKESMGPRRANNGKKVARLTGHPSFLRERGERKSSNKVARLG